MSQSQSEQYEKLKAAQARRYAKLREKQQSKEYQEKQKAKQEQAFQRQLAKQKSKLEDPAYREQQLEKVRAKQAQKPKAPNYEKQQEAIKRQQEKQRAKWNDPEYRKQQFEKAQQKNKTASTKPKQSALKSKGMKGRARTAEEKRLEAKLAKIGCICCRNKGWYTDDMNNQEGQHFISMHHVDGRTKPWAHAKQLPLCQYHHDTPPPPNAPDELFPLHGTGSKTWEEVNGTQEKLLEQVYSMIGEQRPWLESE